MTALERWPETGVPENPGAWLMATAKNRAFDQLRRHRILERKHDALGGEAAAAQPDIEAALDEDVGDDLLRLVLIACHHVLSTDARVALTLRLVGGLTTDEIARGFLVPEPTIAQRIVRAKRTLAEARVPFEAPRGAELAARLRVPHPRSTSLNLDAASPQGVIMVDLVATARDTILTKEDRPVELQEPLRLALSSWHRGRRALLQLAGVSQGVWHRRENVPTARCSHCARHFAHPASPRSSVSSFGSHGVQRTVTEAQCAAR